MELSGLQTSQAYRNLSANVARAPGHLLDNTQQKLAEAQMLLKENGEQHQRNRCDGWKSKMLESDAACFGWLRPDAFLLNTGLISEDLQRHTTTNCTQDASALIRDYWRTVWRRQMHETNRFRMSPRSFAPQRAGETAWGPLSAQELVQAAKKQRGKAAGVDQWHGSEVDSISGDAFQLFLFLQLAANGVV